MVVKCFSCKTLLKVNENDIAAGSKTGVRCPNCGAEGVTELPPPEQDGNTGPLSVRNLDAPMATDSVAMDSKHADSSSADWISGNPREMTMPEDAFREFRFPVETDPLSGQRASWSFRSKMLVLGAASLLVVAVFATLVNIILPGTPPAGIEHMADSPIR
jgi:predicted Zn finger-like uncharacterized protein